MIEFKQGQTQFNIKKMVIRQNPFYEYCFDVIIPTIDNDSGYKNGRFYRIITGFKSDVNYNDIESLSFKYFENGGY